MLLTQQMTTAVRQNQKAAEPMKRTQILSWAKFDHRQRVYLAQPD